MSSNKPDSQIEIIIDGKGDAEFSVPKKYVDEFLVMIARANNTWQDCSTEMKDFAWKARGLQLMRRSGLYQRKELEIKPSINYEPAQKVQLISDELALKRYRCRTECHPETCNCWPEN